MDCRHPGLCVGAAHIPAAEICKTRNKCWEFYRSTHWCLDVALNPGACFKAVCLCRSFSTVFGDVIACSSTSAGSTADLVGLVWELLSCKYCLCMLPCFPVCLHLPLGRRSRRWWVTNLLYRENRWCHFGARARLCLPADVAFMQFHILTRAVLSPKYTCSIKTKLFLSFFWQIKKFYCWPSTLILVLFAASKGSAMPGME